MTYRDDDAAAQAHLASETQVLEGARSERDRLRAELAQLVQLKEDLDAAAASRRGSLLSGRGYLRVAGLMLVMLAAGALDDSLRPLHAWAHYALLSVVTVGLGISVFFADRRQKAVTKLLEEHDARMAGRRGEPETRTEADRAREPSIPNVRVADDVGEDVADGPDATQLRGDAPSRTDTAGN